MSLTWRAIAIASLVSVSVSLYFLRPHHWYLFNPLLFFDFSRNVNELNQSINIVNRFCIDKAMLQLTKLNIPMSDVRFVFSVKLAKQKKNEWMEQSNSNTILMLSDFMMLIVRLL